MAAKGNHGSYIGGHTLVRTHPVGVDKDAKKRRLRGGLTWADRSDDAGILEIVSANLKPKQINLKLCKAAAKRAETRWLLHKKYIRSAESLEFFRCEIGVGSNGFGVFYVAAKTKIAKLKLNSFTDIAKLLNEGDSETFDGKKWNSKNVEMFICVWSADIRRSAPTRRIKAETKNI